MMGGQGELRFYYPVDGGRPLATAVRSLIEDFHRVHPNIEVTLVFPGGYGETLRQARAAVAAGEPADVTVLYSGVLRTVARAGVVTALDRFIEKAGGEAFLADFFPGVLMNTRTEGLVYGLPFQKSTYLLFYNRVMFREAGLNPDAPPRTWEELTTAARRLTIRQDGSVVRWGLELPEAGLVPIFLSFIYQQGAALTDVSGTRVHLAMREGRRALTLLADLSQRDAVMPAQPPPWYDVPVHFNAQRIAMMIHSTSVLPTVRDGAPFPFGAAFVPHGGRYGVCVAGGELCMLQGPPERQQAAWTLMAWLTSPAQQARWFMESGYIAVRSSAWEMEPLAGYVRKFPQVVAAREQLTYGGPELMTEAVEEVRSAMEEAILDAIAGRRSADEALARAQTRAEAAIAGRGAST